MMSACIEKVIRLKAYNNEKKINGFQVVVLESFPSSGCV